MAQRGNKTIVTIRIYDGDRERLERFYPTLKYNRAIREIIKKHLDGLEETLNRSSPPIPKVDAL